MNKLICGLFGVTLTVSTALADAGAPAPSAKDLSRAVEKINYVETDVTGVKLSGYVDVGYIYNFGAAARTHGHATDSNSFGNFNVNAVKLTLEKALTEENKLQAGFRTDLFLGQDAGGFTGNDHGASSLYLQQGYVIFRLPYGNGIDVQLGQINSILGFEADERPANLNITLGANSVFDPGPSPGVLITYPLTEHIKLLAGVNNGNGLSVNEGIDRSNDGYAFDLGVNWGNAGGNVESQIAVQYAPWGDTGSGSADDVSAVGVNWWGTWAPKFTNDRLLLAFNTSLWNVERVDRITGDSVTFVTAALYAKYQFTDLLSLAGRVEYTHTNNADFVYDLGDRSLRSDDLYSFTLTAGFNVVENLVLRAEYRIDVGNNVSYHDNDVAHSVAVEAVYTF
ncbi:MAG: porin [Verrucomicrobiales bacterium]|jgi:hypothetical protein|nr:porin [Verrucomicrobiales bacterium]